jgi:hypothetical protein
LIGLARFLVRPSDKVDWKTVILFAMIIVLSIVVALAIIEEFHLYSVFDGRKV